MKELFLKKNIHLTFILLDIILTLVLFFLLTI